MLATIVVLSDELPSKSRFRSTRPIREWAWQAHGCASLELNVWANQREANKYKTACEKERQPINKDEES